MTDTNPRPWHERVTVDHLGNYLVDGEYPGYPLLLVAERGLLDEAHALAAEVERLRTLLATPADGPLRVERGVSPGYIRPHLLHLGDRHRTPLSDAEADAIESQLAARPAHDLPDGVQPWTADPIVIDGVSVVVLGADGTVEVLR